MRSKLKGVTWLELLVTLAIIGILVAMLVPRYTGNVEHARANEAFGNLKLILAGQRVYRLKSGFYLPFAGTANVAQINQFLRLKLEEKSFTYTVTGTPSTFTATAARLSTAPAPYNNNLYQMDQNGIMTTANGGFQPPQD